MALLWIITLLTAMIANAAGNVYDVAQSMPTPTPTPAPTPAPEAPVDAFIRGYRDGGGDPQYEGHWMADVIPCESEWDVDPAGYHLGLAQFAPGTWAAVVEVTGCREYTSPYCQGVNVAAWMAMIPGGWGTSAGWPTCWWR